MVFEVESSLSAGNPYLIDQVQVTLYSRGSRWGFMPKALNNTKPRKNTTEESLRATPFTEISRLDEEEAAIRLATWQRLTEAKIFAELLTKPEFKHIKDELQEGLTCGLGGSAAKDRIYRIFSEGLGIQLELNDKFVKSLGKSQVSFFQGAVQAGIAGWGSLYWQAKGLLPRDNAEKDPLKATP